MEEYLPHLFNQVQNRRVREVSRALEGLGLTIAHWRVLAACFRLGGCLMSELADFTTVDRTTLTRTVDQLVDMHLAERQSPPDDRRQVRVTLTERGKALYDAAFQQVVAQHRRFLAGLTPEEIVMLRRLLQHVLGNLVDDPDLLQQLLLNGR